MMDEATGEVIERRLDHESGKAEAFYRDLHGPVRVGIEATGPIRWFERLLAELGHERQCRTDGNCEGLHFALAPVVWI